MILIMKRKIEKIKKELTYKLIFFLVASIVFIFLLIISSIQGLSLSFNISSVDCFVLLGIVALLEGFRDIVQLFLYLEKKDKK